MLSATMEKAFNAQVNAELYSAYFYLAMVAYFEEQGLKGMASWMRCQTQEETMHGMKLFGYISERGGRASLTAIDGPKTEWPSALAVFEDVAAHEAKVTGLINSLVDVAQAEKDHAAVAFLQWFVTEQVEEEASAGDVVAQLRLIGNDGRGLLMLDRELGQRVFTPPAAQE